MSENRKPEQGVKLRGAEKVARIPVKVIPTVETARKPDCNASKPPYVHKNYIPFVKKLLVLIYLNALVVVQQPL